MQKYLAVFALLITTNFISAQTGRISGTILDSKTGETLPGATILIEGTTKGASADFDGKFAINNVPVGKVTLIASYISYNSKKISEVIVLANDVTNISIPMDPSTSQDLSEVVVTVTLNKENNTALVLQQKNSSSVSDGISAETIKKTPDRNTADVLKRVSGVTIQDDKFVVVRGLNERYNASYLNGAPLPSTEPDKKAFAFNLFPANMLDNIVVYKTATPDLPGEFAGGIVDVTTKSIPEQNFVSFSAGAGYNDVTTGKAKTVYEGGKLDRFGFDDGSRDLPAAIPPVAQKADWISTVDQGNMAKNFANDWAYSQSNFRPDLNMQFATGYNIKRKEKDFLGVLFSLGHYSRNSLYNMERVEYDELSVNGDNLVIKPKQQDYSNIVNQTQTSTGILFNLACKLNENNSISFKNILSGSADDRFISATGTNNYFEQNVILERQNVRFFSANRVLSSQLIGEHLLPKSKIKIKWTNGVSSINRTVPNLRFDNYGKYTTFNEYDPAEGPNIRDTMYRAFIANTVGPDYAGFRVYSELNETIYSSRLDASRMFKINPSWKVEVKGGGFYQSRSRQLDIRSFGLHPYNQPSQGVFFNDSLLYLPPSEIFSQEHMGVTPNNKGGFKLFEYTKPDDNYSASSTLYAGYAMAELKYTEKIRVVTGLRYESYAQKLSTKFDVNDSILVNNTVNDLLPSLNFIYNITEKTALRLSYYKTLNRAEFRELAVTNWFDPETRLSISGNPELERCVIQNFDLRYEVYPGRGQLFTVSGFYKYFDKPIERYMFPGNAQQIYYSNANFGMVYGAEMEYRVNLGSILKKDSVPFLSNLSLFSNLALIKSEVNVAGLDKDPIVPDTRPMQGQAPYIINTGISYADKKNNFGVSAMLNRVGHRLYLVGSNIIPNRWENARTVIDMQISKTFLNNKLEVRFNVRDLLRQDWIVYYKGTNREDNNLDESVDYLNFRRNYGRTYSFAVTYKL